jgi:hypothetical protein
MMRMIRSTDLFAVLVFFVAVTVGQSAMAYLPHPASWKQESEDRRYVLVMVSPLPVEGDAGHPSFDGNEIRKIRAKYTQSGLYRNDGSTSPLWTIEYFSRAPKVYIAPDEKHIIIAAYSDTFAGGFYANGNRLARYGVDDLVSLVLLKSVLTGRRTACTDSDFDAQTMTYTVTTNQGEQFLFDVNTGRMVGTRSRWPACFGLAFVGIVAAVTTFVVLALRRKRARTKHDQA